MTPTEKQKCIAEQAVYGDLIGYQKEGHVCRMGLKMVFEDCNYSPVLRHLTDLTKEITHKGYNDDKPFIPLVELAKLLTNRKDWRIGSNVAGIRYLYNIDGDFSYNNGAFNDRRYTKYGDATTTKPCDNTKGFDLLHLWHFDTRNLIEKGDAIDVNTLEVNPYEV